MSITTRYMCLQRRYRHRPVKMLGIGPTRKLWTTHTVPLARWRPGL